MTVTKSYLGSATRVSIVLVYGAMAFLIANHLGQTDPDRPDFGSSLAPEIAGEGIRLELDLSASRPVEAWSVTADGVTVEDGSITEHTWSAVIDVAPLPDQRLVIDVIPSQSPDESPVAVRLTVTSEGRTWARTFWARDELVESVSLDSLWTTWEVAP